MPAALSHRLKVSFLAQLLLAIALAGSGVGCKSLPESGVQSFADSTALLKTTLTTAGDTAVHDVAEIHTDDDNSKSKAAALAKELKAEWDKRIRVMDAMNRYASSLSGLVQAGKAGKENATAFVGALQGLVDAVGVAIPANAEVQAILKGAALVYGEIAKSIAAGEIHKAVEHADPIIARLAEQIARDLPNLRSIALERRRTVVNQVKADSDFGPTFTSYQKARTTLQIKAFDLKSQDAAAATDQLLKLTEAMTTLQNDPDFRAYTARLNDTDRAFAVQVDLLDQASLTVQAWATVHHDIVLALRQNRPASVQELVQLTRDLYDIYKEYRAARAAGGKKS